MGSIAEKLGVGPPETVRKWVRTAQAVIDPVAVRASYEFGEVKRLKAENREFIAAELDRPSKNWGGFILEHADRVKVNGLRWGVEPICRVLTEHGTPIAPSSHPRAQSCTRDRRESSPGGMGRVPRCSSGADLRGELLRVWARKVWLASRRDQIDVARCPVEASMRRTACSAPPGEGEKTAIADPHAFRPNHLVKRDFDPDRRISSVYSRRILGWRCSTRTTTPLVLYAIEQTVWTREREGVTDHIGLISHNDRLNQPDTPRMRSSIGCSRRHQRIRRTTGSLYDDAFAENQRPR